MTQQMRRHDRAIPEEEALELLRTGEFGVLATADSDGIPYAVPLNYIYSDGSIFFHCALEGHKIDNIKSNPNVSFCVTGKTRLVPERFTTAYESVVAFGRAELVDGEPKKTALTGLIGKYTPERVTEGEEFIEQVFDKVCVVRINVDRITGKANRA